MIISTIISALEELADMDIQTQLWVNGGPDGMSSYTEAICGLFDDGGVSRAMKSGGLLERPTLLKHFIALDKCVGKVRENQSPENIIADPRMIAVREIAAQILLELADNPLSGTE